MVRAGLDAEYSGCHCVLISPDSSVLGTAVRTGSGTRDVENDNESGGRFCPGARARGVRLGRVLRMHLLANFDPGGGLVPRGWVLVE